MRLMRNSTS